MAKPIYAFPFNGEYFKTPGMELRDWFAGQALTGAVAAMMADHSLAYPDEWGHLAYKIADAFMEARKIKQEEAGEERSE